MRSLLVSTVLGTALLVAVPLSTFASRYSPSISASSITPNFNSSVPAYSSVTLSGCGWDVAPGPYGLQVAESSSTFQGAYWVYGTVNTSGCFTATMNVGAAGTYTFTARESINQNNTQYIQSAPTTITVQ